MAGHSMTADELASMQKGQMGTIGKFDSMPGEDDDALHLSEADIKWWRDAKLGLFIHWGVYSVIGKGEWAYHNEKIPAAEYRRIAAEQFHPQAGPKEITDGWLDMAQEAGMKYAVMVTRHHDGFALWDSKASYQDFTSVKLGPKADYVKAFTDGCHERGLGTGLYYSPMDWRFPGYFDPKGLPENAQLMKKQAYGQLKELCTEYGKVDILWYDGGWLAHKGTDADAAWFWEPIKLNRQLRVYQPGILFTPRSGYRGDFACDEGPAQVTGGIAKLPWEKCMSVSTAWGYRPGDTYHSSAFLIRMLANTICRDGNLLLNIGPDPQGQIPEEEKQILRELGEWMRGNGEAVYGTRGGPWQPVEGIYGSVYRDRTIYLHILDCKKFQKELLPPMGREIEKAELLTGEEVPFETGKEGTRIRIPENLKTGDAIDMIVRLVCSKPFTDNCAPSTSGRDMPIDSNMTAESGRLAVMS